MTTNLLLTGNPGVGKTTLVKRVIQRLGHLALSGFYTEEIRIRGRRAGFRAVALNGASGVFAHREFRASSPYRLGPYGVHPRMLENLVLPHLDWKHKRPDLVVVDEIAKMELLSQPLREAILELLDSPCPVLGTIARHGAGVLKRIRARDDVHLIKVTLKNRSVLHGEILRQLDRNLGRGSPQSRAHRLQ